MTCTADRDVDRITTDEEIAWLREVYDLLFSGNYTLTAANPLMSLGDQRYSLTAGETLNKALTIYSAFPDAFDEDEVQLLTELANDLAFGIRAARGR